MAYEQNKLEYSRKTDMPGLEYSDEDIRQKKRLATNALGIEPPEDLMDGEFFLKDNDPQDFYRTLYVKRGDSLDKLVTFTDTGKALFDGVNEINLDDDEEVKGVLPKRKIITATTTVQYDGIQNIVCYDGSKFKEVAKDDFTDKITELVNAGIDLNNYFNKTKDKINLTSQVEDVLPFENGGTGSKTGNAISSNKLSINIMNTSWESNTNYNNFWYANADMADKNIPLPYCVLTKIYEGNARGIALAADWRNNIANRTLYINHLHDDTGQGNWGEWEALQPMIKTYTTSDGQWTETLLSTGEILLEGWGSIIVSSLKSVTIKLPKTINISKSMSVIGNYQGGVGNESELSVLCNFIGSSITIANNSNSTRQIYWQFKGILA